MITVSSVFSNVPPLFANLAKVLSGDIDCSHHSIQAHSTDGSPYQIRPQAILYPKTTSDIKHAIAFAKEYGIPLTVAGGSTAATGGALGEGVIIDMTRYFSQIRRVNMMDHTITVDAGVTIDQLRQTLASWNLEIPVLQEEHSRATIGGLVATKSATSRTFYTGTIREWIEGMTIVVDSGEEHSIKDGITPSGRLLGIYQSVFPLLSDHGPILRASRRELSDDATGYSLWNTSIGPRQLLDQLVGSEGTLAVMTSITFRVTSKKPEETTLLLPIPSLSLLESTISIAKHHLAESLFMFDHAYRVLTDKLHPLLIRTDVPETPYYLLTTFRGKDSEVVGKSIHSFIKALPFTYDVPFDIPERIATKLMSFSFLHTLFFNYTKGAHMIATSGEGLIVSAHDYAECLQTLDETIGKEGRLYTITGYAGSGHLAVTSSFDGKSPTYGKDLQNYRDTLCGIVAQFKGGISATGGDGLERTSALPFVFNESTLLVFKKIKEAWDPQGIFNPSKKIGITKDYLIKHAAHTPA